MKLNTVLKLFLSVFFLIMYFPETIHAQNENETEVPSKFEALYIQNDFDISADLKNPAWEKALSVYIKNQVQPNDDAAAKVQTEVKALYSKKNLYIGFIANDPNPEDIRANITDRDNAFQDDFVGVFIDPFNNNQQAFELFVNPLGIQMDGMRSGNSEDMNFDLLWYSDGKVTDSGYRAVMKIPFKSLNFPKKQVHNWSIQFLRNYPRNSRYQFTWTDVELSNPCLICQNGMMTGIKDIENTKTVELLPYAMSFQESTIRNAADPQSGLNHGTIDGRFGGSVFYAPSSMTSINAVINPDFSQVETDAAQISANETFALFFPEKRPFFLKEAELFSTDENLFYSRTINRPLAAGKFTRQKGNYSIAFLSAYDRNAPFIVPGKYGSSLIRSDVNAYNNVLRGKYNLGSESFIGGLITTRNQGAGSNYVGSIDWDLLLTDNYYFSGQLAYASTRELDDTGIFNSQRTFGRGSYDAAFNGEQYEGSLISTAFSREAKYYNFSFEYKSYSPTFQTQTGFINQTDRRQFEGSQSINYYPNTSFLSRGTFSVSGTWRYDYGGQFQERFIFTRLSNNFGGQTNLTLSFLPVNDERFRGEFFTGMNRMMVNVNTNPLNALSLNGHIDFGEYVNRRDNPTLGEGYNISGSVTVKPTPRLEMDFSYRYSTLSSVDGSENYFSGDIYRFNGNYNFSKRLFTRLIVQYDSFGKQLQFYPLLYYKANPFTKFYIGMTDYMNYYDQPGLNGYRGFKQTDRQFFVKFQYLIRS